MPISLEGGLPSAGTPLNQNVQTNQIIFSYSGKELFVTTGAGTVKILSYPEFELLHTLNAHTSACLSVDLCPRAKHLAIGGSDALVSVWDTYNWVSLYTISDIDGPARTVSFSFDGNYVCGGSDEGTGIPIVSCHLDDTDFSTPKIVSIVTTDTSYDGHGILTIF